MVRRWIRSRRAAPIGLNAVPRTVAALEAHGFRTIDFGAGPGGVFHVVVGPTGVFAIETKGWTGRVRLKRNGRLVVSGRDRDDAVRRATAKAQEVARRLKEAEVAMWVEAVIVLAATSLPHGRILTGTVAVVELDDLGRFLTDRPAPVNALEIEHAVDAIRRGGRPSARAVS
jgi:hypothetical protein